MADELDLYLLVGQSNMAGRGIVSDEDRQPDPRILVLNREDTWASQGEPLHSDKASAGAGLGFTFARKVADQRPGRQIGLIPCAVGGTPLSRWLPKGDLYEEAVRRTRIAQQSGQLQAILWHQGENDANRIEDSNSYAERLRLTIEGFREDLNAPTAPFIAGQLGEFLYTRSTAATPFAKIVNDQIASLAPDCSLLCRRPLRRAWSWRR